MQSDAELVRLALTGDRQAFGRLFERYERSVLAVGLTLLRDFHTAQDVSQTAFVRAYQNLGGLREGACFGPWVREIARREALDVRRHNLLRKSAPLPASESGGLPGDIEQACQWASKNLTLFQVRFYDGEYEYTYRTGEAPWDFSDRPSPKLDVRWYGGDWIDTLLPIREQWPHVNNVGPVRVLKGERKAPPGCVWLRFEDKGLRRDWCVDTAKDNICVELLEFEKKGEEWVQRDSPHVERADLTRLPSGQ